MKPILWIALALLGGTPALADTIRCPDGVLWAGNDLRRCPCCARCDDGTWVKGDCGAPSANAEGCVRMAQLVASLGIEDPLAEKAHSIRPRNRVEVRGAPNSSEDSEVVGQLPTGSRAEVLEERGDELRVRSLDVELTGWIPRKVVEHVALRDATTRDLCNAR